MVEHSLLAMWSLAFSLGIMHAFDADHVLTVSTLGNLRPKNRSLMLFCRNWALGHGMTIMLVSLAVLVLGFAIPTSLSEHAEFLVAIMLIMLAGILLFNIYTASLSSRQTKTDTKAVSGTPRKGAVLIGMLHGLAGSAPLLTVLPMSQMHSAWQALVYLLLFSLGVVMAMLAFGSVLNGFYCVVNKNPVTLKIIRTLFAVLALTVGITMLQGM